MPFQMPEIQNNIGNALANIGQIRQQRTQNALAERQLGLSEAAGRRQQQQFDAEQAAAQRAQLIDTTKNVLGALARAPADQRMQLFAQMPDVPEEMRQRMLQSPDAFTDQNIALALNRFGTLTPEQIFGDERRMAEAKAKPEVLVTFGPDGKTPVRRAFNPYGPELAAGVADAPDAGALLTDRRLALGQDITRRGQDMTDARAREAARIQREGLSRPVEYTDPKTGKPILVQFDARGRPVPVRGLLPEGAGGGIQSAQTALAGASDQIALVDQALNHPGRTASTGISSAFPTIPGSDAANFEAVLAQIQGGAFLQAFQSLKGGGAITEQEGRKAEAAIARLQTNQSDAAFEASLRDLRSVLRNGQMRTAARLGVPAPPDPGGSRGATGSWDAPDEVPAGLPEGVRVRRKN